MLRYQARPDYASLAQFSDKLDASELHEASMCFQEEDLSEDEEGSDVIKDAEYFAKKRRKQRRFYRRKQTIVMQHESKQESIRHEGKIVSLELNPENHPTEQGCSQELSII